MSATENLAAEVIHLTNPSLSSSPSAYRIATSQTQHRLNILQAWFGDLDAAKTSLNGKTLLEIGCGQGDTTVALAWAVGPTGKVIAIDQAPLEYGAPETLGEAQQRISRSSPLGGRIEWIRADPVEAVVADPKLRTVDYIVLAHSLLYMKSGGYVAELFRALHVDVPPSGLGSDGLGSSPKLLIAEWGMRVSRESARAHLYAVQAQAARPLISGNVQLYLEPEMVLEVATNAGWRREREVWIVSPDMDDGAWEVAATRSMSVDGDAGGVARRYLEEMERVVSGSVKCMDVWTAVLQ